MSDTTHPGPDPAGEINPSSDQNPIVPDTGKRPGLLVIALGLLTTAIALFIVYLLNQTEFQPMSFYILMIVPIGAVVVGLVAGSGYALGSLWTGAKVGGGLLVMIVILQIVSYFAAQYVEYVEFKAEMLEVNDDMMRRLNEQAAPGDRMPPDELEQLVEETLDSIRREYTFFKHFDTSTRSFVFDTDDGQGQPLGVWGYGIRILEVLGFALGGLIIPVVLKSRPYCSDCQVYQKKKQLGLIPAGVNPRKLKKKDPEAQAALESDAQEAIDGGIQLVEESAEMLEEKRSGDFQDLMQQFKASHKDIQKQTTRIDVEMQYCPNCFKGAVIYSLHSGHGEEAAKEVINALEIDEKVVRDLTRL